MQSRDPQPPLFFVVMRLRPWSSVLVGSQGKPAHVTDDSGTVGFLMVFATRAEAEAYAEDGEQVVPFGGMLVTNAPD